MSPTPQVQDVSVSFPPYAIIILVSLGILTIVAITLRLLKKDKYNISGILIIISLLGIMMTYLIATNNVTFSERKQQLNNEDVAMEKALSEQDIKVVTNNDTGKIYLTTKTGIQDFYGQVESTIVKCRINNNGKTFSVSCIPPSKSNYVPLDEMRKELSR